MAGPTFNSHLNIRVNQAHYERFTRVCTKAGAEPSTVLRALMSQAVACGLEYDNATGLPILKRKLP